MGRRGASMTAAISVAIDAGQTAMKVRLQRADAATREVALDGIRTHEPLLPQLAEATRAVLRDTAQPLGLLSAGVSGLTDRDADAESLRVLLADVAPGQVMLTHDSVTSFLGTLGDECGVVVAAGTGVVTLGVGRRAVARVDGWGNIMGDAGSGYWIGREGLDAAMRAYDGRGEPTVLTDAVRERWPRIEDAYIDLQSHPDRIRVVAGFAETVSGFASTDAVSARICVAAARELAHSAATALARVADPEETPDAAPLVGAIGGVFRSTLIRARFEELLRGTVPRVRFEPPHGSALDGAAALAGLGPRHPLRALVSVAGSAVADR